MSSNGSGAERRATIGDPRSGPSTPNASARATGYAASHTRSSGPNYLANPPGRDLGVELRWARNIAEGELQVGAVLHCIWQANGGKLKLKVFDPLVRHDPPDSGFSFGTEPWIVIREFPPALALHRTGACSIAFDQHFDGSALRVKARLTLPGRRLA